MKKILFTILSLATLTLAHGQVIKTEKEKFRIVSAGTMKGEKSRTLFYDGVIINVPNKLDIEADSVLYEKDKSLLTAYRTKSFTFTGKVVMGKENNRICRFRLGEDTLRIE